MPLVPDPRGQLSRVVEFWREHGVDNDQPGLYCCLDSAGDLYDTRKSTWHQARIAIVMLSLGTPEIAAGDLHAVDKCLALLDMYGPQTRLPFITGRDGTPLEYRDDLVAETLYALASFAYSNRTGDARRFDGAYTLATDIADRWLQGTSRLDFHLAGREALLGDLLCVAMLGCVIPDSAARNRICNGLFASVLKHDLPNCGLLLERPTERGRTTNRFVNVGHSIEIVVALYDLAASVEASDVKRWCEAKMTYLGEHDLELITCNGAVSPCALAPTDTSQIMPTTSRAIWWVQAEVLRLFFRLAKVTGVPAIADEIGGFTFTNFPDPRDGEWFTEVTSTGAVTNTDKGSFDKSCFHVGHMLLDADAS